MRQLLRYLVDATLAGDAERLKGYAIGVDVFERGAAFDPGTDPIVRVQAGRLRKLLDTYYRTAGQHDAVRITIPKGGSEPIELINYEKAPNVTVGKVLSIASKNPVNILEQWKADSATFTVDVAGTLPEANWTIDMSVHFAGKASYKY